MNHEDVELETLLNSAESPGPMPGDLEEEIWHSSLTLYRELVERAAPRADAPVEIELDLAPVMPLRNRRDHLQIIALRVAAVVALVVGIWAGVNLKDDQPQQGVAVSPDVWTNRVNDANTSLRSDVEEADRLRIRNLPLGLVASTQYLETIGTSATNAALAFDDAPGPFAATTARHADALREWGAAARKLVSDIEANPRAFLDLQEDPDDRFAGIASLERDALETSCEPLRPLLGDTFTCGVISTPIQIRAEQQP